MKFDITSDLHLDFFLNFRTSLNDKKLSRYCSEVLFSEGHVHSEVLLVAGDLGHYNYQAKALFEYLVKHYYKKVIFVVGNHDYYLISNNIIQKYGNSRNRVKELKEMFADNENIHMLDGDIIEYNGIRIGGCGMWYDGSYCNKVNLFCNPLALWKEKLNDHSNIRGYVDFYDILVEERPKLEAIYRDSDIIMTHVNPMPHAKFFDEEYRTDPVTGFYAFDGEYQVEHTPAKLWVFGHTHTSKDIEVYGTRILCNALGYPKKTGDWNRVITVEVDV